MKKSFKNMSGALSRDEMQKIIGGYISSGGNTNSGNPGSSLTGCPINCGDACDGNNGCKCTNSGTSNSFCEAK